jgi:hypothetical protein
MNTFLTKNSELLSPIQDKLELAKKKIEGNIQWMNEFGELILNWLRKKNR